MIVQIIASKNAAHINMSTQNDVVFEWSCDGNRLKDSCYNVKSTLVLVILETVCIVVFGHTTELQSSPLRTIIVDSGLFSFSFTSKCAFCVESLVDI